MGLPPLAQVSDVSIRYPILASSDPARISALLDDVSAKIRNFTHQDFTLTQTVQKTRPIGNKLRLPQRPVISVDSIQIRPPESTTLVAVSGWWWDGSDEIRLASGDQIINLSEDLGGALELETPICFVTYTHGYAEIPEDVVGVACSMLARIITAPGAGGVISETVGEFSYRLSDTAAQGPMTMTGSEKETLLSYRPKNKVTLELRE